MPGKDDFVGLSSFVGGESQDIKYGMKYQYDYGRHIDVRKRPTGFTVLPGMQEIQSAAVTDLIQDMTQLPDGTRYALGDAGNIYKITTANVISKIGALGQAGGAGIFYRSDSDCVYITGQTKIARIKTASTAPILDVNWFAYGVSAATTAAKTGGTNTYSVPLTITENATNMRTFIVDIEPAYQIGVKFVTKGTGNYTLTLHDDANNLLGTATLTNANVTAGQINYFVFTTPIRLQPSVNNYVSTSSSGRTYHYHLTSTVADGTVQTTTASSLADADLEYWAYALAPTVNGLHPIYQFSNLTLFGNGKYTAAYEPLQDNPTTSDFFRHRLTLPPGYEINGFAQLELYAAITAERRSTTATADFQEGKMLLWDGVATTYNRYFDVPEGSPESIFSHKNILHMIVGGAYYQSSGGQPQKVRTIRNTDSEFSNIADTTHVNPHMMTIRRGILLMGYPTITTNQSLEHVVYGMGSINNQYPASWTTSYNMSTGTILNNGTNNIRLGMLKSYGDALFLSWRDDTTGTAQYGLDVVNNSSPPAPDFQIQTLYFDNGEPYKEKLAKKALAVFENIPAGVSMRMWYMINNDGNRVYATDDGTASVTSGNVVQINIPREFIGLQVGLEGTVTGTATPFCKGLYIVFDPQTDRDEVSQ